MSGTADAASGYTELFAAMRKLNSEAARMSGNQKTLLAHNSQLVRLTTDFREVHGDLQKAGEGKPKS